LNPPLRYSISPNTEFLLMKEPCVISVELSNLELGLVRFYPPFLGITFCQITLQLWLMYLLAVLQLILAIYQQLNSQMPLGNTFVPTLVLLVELSVEYHFSTEFMQMLMIFSSPRASAITLAVSPFENVTGYQLIKK
jgi:hypothetical protein